MPRPRKTGPRLINGTYCVQVYDGNKRKTLSLQTTDHHEACLRYKGGHTALLRRIREEHKAARQLRGGGLQGLLQASERTTATNQTLVQESSQPA